MPASSKRAVSDGEEFDGDTPREPEPIAKIFFTAPPNLSSLENVLQTLVFVFAIFDSGLGAFWRREERLGDKKFEVRCHLILEIKFRFRFECFFDSNVNYFFEHVISSVVGHAWDHGSKMLLDKYKATPHAADPSKNLGE